MRKRKVAVFVEGQTELVFLRDMVLKWYDYDAEMVAFDCISLIGQTSKTVPFQYGNSDSENYFLFVNVGNDNSVLSKMLGRFKSMQSKGFNLILGLRDMYSRQYRELCGESTIKWDLIDKIRKKAEDQIAEMADSDVMALHFAIMEVEAWLMGMNGFLLKIDGRLTEGFIKENTGIDLHQDPEVSFFHPAADLAKIYQSVGKSYSKHLSDISAISAALEKADYVTLTQSGRCNSFRHFADALLLR